MERFAQLFDDLEDLWYAFGLVSESIRSRLRFATFVFLSFSLQALGIWLAVNSPPLATAVVALLLVWLLYQAVVSPGPRATLST